MSGEGEKEKILLNLRNLEDIPEYKTISVTKDYTITERRIINNLSDRAKERNKDEELDSKFVCKAGGSPKNGLRLKRLLKSTQTKDRNEITVTKNIRIYKKAKNQIMMKIKRNHLTRVV